MNLAKVNILSNPKVPKVLAIKQNTPKGAILRITPVIAIITFFNSLKILLSVGGFLT